MKKQLCLVLAVMLYVLPTMALQVSDFTFSHIGRAEGLDNQRVFSIIQAPSGAIWWATMEGVGRYNGSRVKSYRLDENVSFSHMGGRVIGLTMDESNAIYAFDNSGGIYTFNPLRDRFDYVVDVSKEMGHDVGLNAVHMMDNRMILGLHDGAYLMQDKQVKKLVKDVYVNNIVSIKNRLLFCTREGLYDEKGLCLLRHNIECCYYDELSSKLWLGGYENGLHIVSFAQDGKISNDQFVPIVGEDLRSNPIRSICPYDDETMLIGIDGEGVYQMQRDGRGRCQLLFDANESEHGVLHGNGVYSVITDSWKNIVIGSYSGGIDIARPIGSTTAVYRHIHNNQQSLLNDHVNVVMTLSDNLLMMGTDNGISILNTQTGIWQHTCQGTVALGGSRSPSGSVLIPTYGKGVYDIDNQGHIRKIYNTSGGVLKDDHVYATFTDKDGTLWVGSLNGDLLHISGDASLLRSYPVHDVQSITQLASGQIAVGTAFGLKLITPGSDGVKDLNYAPSGVEDVNPFVTHLLTAGLELWIATDGGGVYVYHIAKHESRQITTKHGLPSNYVRSLARSKDGRIWIATDKGLAFLQPNKPTEVVNVNYCYGLDSEYSRGAVVNLANGDLLYGTSTGALVVHPENVQSVNYTAKLRLLGINCMDEQEELEDDQILRCLHEGKLILEYNQRSFDLLFESINMRNHYDIAYRYKMGHGEWSQPFSQQYMRFVSLEPGRHQLILECISRTSGIVIDSLTLTIVIAQPWWNSWWMWCVYVALVLLVFYGAWRVYQLHERYMRLTIDHLQTDSTEMPEQVETTGQPEKNEAVQDFVDKATSLIVEHLSDSEFNIDCLCREMAMSRTLFYVKLKSYTGKSPQDFIRIIRLERAAAMLRSGRNVTDVAALTGFENPKYFSTVFKKYFGVSPSKYQ